MSQDETNTQQDRFARILQEWQSHVLQLDRGNQLLNFRPGKSAVRILDQSPSGLVETILSSRSRTGLTFDYAEPRPRGSSTENDVASVDDEDDDADAYVIPGNLSGDHPPLDLQRRLRNLQRRDR